MQARTRVRPTPAGAGRTRTWWFAGLVAAVAVIDLAVAAGYLYRPDTGGAKISVATAPTIATDPAPPKLDRAALDALLARRSRAVLARDRNGFLGTVDPAATAFLAEQRRLFDNLVKVPLDFWQYRLAEAQPAGPASWRVRLVLNYRLRGFDTAVAVRNQYASISHRPGSGWVVTGNGTAYGLTDDPEVWDTGRLTVVQGRRSLVLGADKNEADLRQIADRIDTSVPVVSGVVGTGWAQRAVVLVPATQRQAAGLVGEAQNLGQIAALATVMGAPGQPVDRIVVAPQTFPRLNALGRRVVLTHELTHVATGGARDTLTPMWLVEGLADYIGYQGERVPTTAAAKELAREVSAGRVPTQLPDQAAFANSAARLPQAYQEAWLACRMIVERYDEARLVRLYRAAGAAGGAGGPAGTTPTGTPSASSGTTPSATPGTASPGSGGSGGVAVDPKRREAQALRTVLGLETTEFVEMWRDYLRKELGG